MRQRSRKVVLFTAASLDSFIALPDGSVEWLRRPEFHLPGEDFGYEKFYASIDTTLMGKNTLLDASRPGSPFPYRDKTNYVLTHSSRIRKSDHVKFIHRNIPSFVRSLKQREGKDIWLVGGSQTNALLLRHGLIDRIILTIVPVILGRGIPLFAFGAQRVDFLLKKSRTYSNGFVQIMWDKQRK
jgi:dihydrofolate reductase